MSIEYTLFQVQRFIMGKWIDIISISFYFTEVDNSFRRPKCLQLWQCLCHVEWTNYFSHRFLVNVGNFSCSLQKLRVIFNIFECKNWWSFKIAEKISSSVDKSYNFCCNYCYIVSKFHNLNAIANKFTAVNKLHHSEQIVLNCTTWEKLKKKQKKTHFRVRMDWSLN